jgi:hypothetical protein
MIAKISPAIFCIVIFSLRNKNARKAVTPGYRADKAKIAVILFSEFDIAEVKKYIPKTVEIAAETGKIYAELKVGKYERYSNTPIIVIGSMVIPISNKLFIEPKRSCPIFINNPQVPKNRTVSPI